MGVVVQANVIAERRLQNATDGLERALDRLPIDSADRAEVQRLLHSFARESGRLAFVLGGRHFGADVVEASIAYDAALADEVRQRRHARREARL